MGKVKDLTGKIKCPAFIRKHKIISIIVLVLIIAVIVFFAFRGSRKEVAVNQISDYAVAKGDVSVTITGSGTLQANDQYDITSLVSGDVLADYFEEGDMVEEDDVLYQLDSSNAESGITRAQNSLEKARNSYNDAMDNVGKLNVKSDISGTVTAVNAKKGQSVTQNSVLFTVTDNETLRLEINFNENDAKSIYAGNPAQVYLSGNSQTYYGTVKQVANGSFVSSEGVKVSQVIIEVDNPGTISEGDKATAIVNNYACAAEGVFYNNGVCNVVAGVSGDISKVNVVVGDRVSKNTVLAVIDSSSTNRAYREAQLSYNDAQTSLSDAQDSLEDYIIKAPISGTVIEKTIKAGDKISAGSGGQTVMATIADMSQMKFTISVDELDIAKMKEGQTVKVTADALPGQVFEGYIEKVPDKGDTQNSVTTYSVEVIVKEYGELRIGFNVDAEIIVSEVTDVLTVPLSAVQRGNVVYVKDEDLTEEQKNQISQQTKNSKNPTSENDENKRPGSAANRYEGYTPVRVETGLSNSDVVEIKSGLTEGQRIAVITFSSETTRNNMMMGMGGGMPGGGMSGGMSGGGMSGGMSGGGMSGGGMSGGGTRQGGGTR